MENGGCGECRLCQSACKTSCGVANSSAKMSKRKKIMLNKYNNCRFSPEGETHSFFIGESHMIPSIKLNGYNFVIDVHSGSISYGRTRLL